jgi:hypothetical protein
VHRDLKPSNVLLGAGVKVLDFGLAKIRPPALGFEPPHVTTEGAILGTLHYLSPEQARGQPTGPRSDIFSFGVVLYEMLAGRRAFDGPNAAQVMAAILALEPAPLGAAVPRGLELVLRPRCLAKDPEERWQSARDLKAALEGLSTASDNEPAIGAHLLRGECQRPGGCGQAQARCWRWPRLGNFTRRAAIAPHRTRLLCRILGRSAAWLLRISLFLSRRPCRAPVFPQSPHERRRFCNWWAAP